MLWWLVILSTKLHNIDKANIRGEYKAAIYHRYLLPSLRFLFTIHDITKTHLQKLDKISDKFLKSWIGLPRCATTSIIHLKNTLDIKTLRHLHDESHPLAHTNSRLKSDEIVNLALDNKIERESKWKRKKSTAVDSERLLEAAKGCTIPINVVVTTQIPDLVITSHDEKKMWIFELTVPFETRIDEAHAIKESKYDSLLNDIEDRGYEVHYEAFEVGSRGHISEDNIGRLKRILKLCSSKHSAKSFIKNISFISATASYAIFAARNQPEWKENTRYIEPLFN